MTPPCDCLSWVSLSNSRVVHLHYVRNVVDETRFYSRHACASYELVVGGQFEASAAIILGGGSVVTLLRDSVRANVATGTQEGKIVYFVDQFLLEALGYWGFYPKNCGLNNIRRWVVVAVRHDSSICHSVSYFAQICYMLVQCWSKVWFTQALLHELAFADYAVRDNEAYAGLLTRSAVTWVVVISLLVLVN